MSSLCFCRDLMCQHDALDERLHKSKPFLCELQIICSWHMKLGHPRAKGQCIGRRRSAQK